MRSKTNSSELILLSHDDDSRIYSICGVIFDVRSNFADDGTTINDILFELVLQKLKENSIAAQKPFSTIVGNDKL